MAKQKKIFRYHPLLGKREFSKEHAERLDKLEEINPSGWSDKPIKANKVDGTDATTDSDTNQGDEKESGSAQG